MPLTQDKKFVTAKVKPENVIYNDPNHAIHEYGRGLVQDYTDMILAINNLVVGDQLKHLKQNAINAVMKGMSEFLEKAGVPVSTLLPVTECLRVPYFYDPEKEEVLQTGEEKLQTLKTDSDMMKTVGNLKPRLDVQKYRENYCQFIDNPDEAREAVEVNLDYESNNPNRTSLTTYDKLYGGKPFADATIDNLNIVEKVAAKRRAKNQPRRKNGRFCKKVKK